MCVLCNCTMESLVNLNTAHIYNDKKKKTPFNKGIISCNRLNGYICLIDVNLMVCFVTLITVSLKDQNKDMLK